MPKKALKAQDIQDPHDSHASAPSKRQHQIIHDSDLRSTEDPEPITAVKSSEREEKRKAETTQYAAPEPNLLVEQDEERKVRKKKLKQQNFADDAIFSNQGESDGDVTVKRKKPKLKANAEPETEHEVPSTKKSKKRRAEVAESEPVALTAAKESNPAASQQKKKRRTEERNENSAPDAADDLPSENTSATRKLSRKRKKDKQAIEAINAVLAKGCSKLAADATTFPDPEADETLEDQVKKNLSYARLYSTQKSDWKFNKARQNWLIRNIWETKIPDKYIPMAIIYLQSTRGSSRRALISKCEESVAEAAAASNDDAQTARPTLGMATPISRAKDLLAALLSAEPEKVETE